MKIKEISDYTVIEQNASIDKVIDCLNKSTHKIIFVLDNNRLVGTITDGDIRRRIYGRKDDISKLQACDVMHRNFRYILPEDYEKSNTNDLIKYDVEYLPVLNTNFQILKVIRIQVDFEELSKLKTKVLIMAGGKGTRLYPLTKVIPKPLVPFGNKTIIESIMEQFMKSGFDEFILSVNYKKELIKNYFAELSYNIDYIEEPDFLGTAGSISYLRVHNIQKPFFVANCDVLLNLDFADVFEYHLKEEANITMISSKEKVNVAYGVITFDEEKNYLRIDEKPNYEFNVNTGIYVLNPEVIDLIEIGEKVDMPEIIDRARSKGMKIKVYESNTEMIDIGQWEYYKRLL